MSSLATLGSALSKSSGIPAIAATVPGDSSSSTLNAGTPAPATATPAASKIVLPQGGSTALGTLGSSIQSSLGTTPTTPAAPIGGMSSKQNPLPGSAAAVVQNANASFGQAMTDGQNPGLTSITDNATLVSAQQQVTQGNTDKANAATQTQTYTQQQTAAAQQVNAVAPYVQSGFLSFKGPAAGQAPGVILTNLTVNEAGYPVGTAYTLQPDGSYKEITLSGTKADAEVWGQITTNGSSTPTDWNTVVYVSHANEVDAAVNAYTSFAKANVGLAAATALSTKADAEIASGTTAVTNAQNTLNSFNAGQASNTNLTQLGQALSGINAGTSNAYNTDVTTGQANQSAQLQTAGINANAANSGANLDAAAFGAASTAQTAAGTLATQKGALVDQQGQEVASQLQSSLSAAQGQSGLQLQTMNQDLSEAISSLQSDLQYATAEQQQAIQAYIQALQNQQATLANNINQSGQSQSEITNIATGIANGVSNAGAAYVAASKKS